MRWSFGTIPLVAGLLLTGCSSGRECAGPVSVDQLQSAGQPSAKAALDALLAERPQWLNLSGWVEAYRTTSPNRSITFTAPGDDTVKVWQSSRDGHWYLDSYRGCRA